MSTQTRDRDYLMNGGSCEDSVNDNQTESVNTCILLVC